MSIHDRLLHMARMNAHDEIGGARAGELVEGGRVKGSRNKSTANNKKAAVSNVWLQFYRAFAAEHKGKGLSGAQLVKEAAKEYHSLDKGPKKSKKKVKLPPQPTPLTALDKVRAIRAKFPTKNHHHTKRLKKVRYLKPYLVNL